MTPPIRLTLALIAGAITTLPAFAASTQKQIALRNATGVAQIAPRRAALSTQAAATATPSPGSPQANPNRAYPPSCAAYPLPTQPSGPTYSANMPLQQFDTLGNVNAETVTVTVWRIACSSSGGVTPYNPDGTGHNAMTLMRIQRSASNEGVSNYYPISPQVIAVSAANLSSCNNGNINTSCYYARAVTEPNTYLQDAANDTPIYNSTTYVLENYQGRINFAYNGAFKLWLDSGLENYGYNVGMTTINVPAYTPTPDTYPAAFNPIPIDGYAGTGWYDPAHSGEGIQINVIDMGDGTRTFFAAWYTYDSLGIPAWIVAQSPPLKAGVTSTGDITGYYYTGGGFAGNFDKNKLNQQIWGTLNFQFQDCNHMQFTYNGQTNAANGPSGKGTLNWVRLADNNGMSCE
ncbi:MAG: hypothetical protein LBQ20_13005 [Rhodanobacter sp.]|jgi:hypothetical protein|nr:hypothetical protein [Rhodanobacter sp.]